MEPTHFESLYPADAYSLPIEKIIGYIKEGNSCQLIGLPGTGRSNVFGLLSYNRAVRELHFGENQKWYHFVLCNFSEVKKRTSTDVMKFLFLSLADSLRDRDLQEEHDMLHKIFKEHASFNDEIVLLQGLKEAITYLCIQKELTVIFLCDRFDSYIPSLTESFFDTLRVLRDIAKYRFSIVTSHTRALEELASPELLSDFSEFISTHHVYLPLHDNPSLDFRIKYLEKSTGKTFARKMLEQIETVTAGQGKLTRLSLEYLLEHDETSSQEDLVNTLLGYTPMRKALLDIWQSLTPQEQHMLETTNSKQIASTKNGDYLEKIGLVKNGTITIPLFAVFVKQEAKRQDKALQKITFNQETNTIAKGDQIVSNLLTAAEFRLLKYFLNNNNRVVDREEVITAVWKDTQSVAGVTDQALDQLIFRLRRKIETDPNHPQHLQTVKGRGFQFIA